MAQKRILSNYKIAIYANWENGNKTFRSRSEIVKNLLQIQVKFTT